MRWILIGLGLLGTLAWRHPSRPKHVAYGRYVARHKWFVLQAGLGYGAPLPQLLLHDLSKFLPDEWGPYAEWFYGYNGGSWHHSSDPVAFEHRRRMLIAFLKHLHRNPHHHQHWRLLNDGGKPEEVFPLPDRYVREMVADWEGAGRAITGKIDTLGWYTRNRGGMVLHPETRARVDRLLGWSEASGG